LKGGEKKRLNVLFKRKDRFLGARAYPPIVQESEFGGKF